MSELPPTWTPAPNPHTISHYSPQPNSPAHPGSGQLPDRPGHDAGSCQLPMDLADRTGWKILEGKTASISIPPTYKVLDFAGVFMEMMFGVMEAFAEGFIELAVNSEKSWVPHRSEIETPDLGEMPDIDFIIAMEEASQSAIILVTVDIASCNHNEDLLNEALSDREYRFSILSREKYQTLPFQWNGLSWMLKMKNWVRENRSSMSFSVKKWPGMWFSQPRQNCS